MPRKLDSFLLWLCIGVGIALRMTDLGVPDFATDEAQAALGATAAWTPLGMQIMGLAQSLFGHTIIVARSVSAVFGIALLPLLYLIAREYTDKKTALLITAIAAIFPTHIVFSRLAYLSAQLLFGWTLMLYCFLKTRKAILAPQSSLSASGVGWMFALFFASVFATLIKSQGLLFPGLLILGTFIEQWKTSKKLSIVNCLPAEALAKAGQLSIVLVLSLLPTTLYILTHPGIAATVLLYGGNMYGISGFFHRFIELFTTWWTELSLFLIVLVFALPSLKNFSWPVSALLALVSAVGFILGPDHAYYVSDLVLFALPMGVILSRGISHQSVYVRSGARITECALLLLTLIILGPTALSRTQWTYPLYQEEGYWNTHAETLNAVLKDEETVTVLGFPGHHLRWYLTPRLLVGREMTPPYPTAFILIPRGTASADIKGTVVYDDAEFTILEQQ